MDVLTLPAGLEKDGAASDAGIVQRLEVRDERGAAPRRARRRVLFVFPNLRQREWADRLDERVAKLAGEADLPHVRRPLEIGTIGDEAMYVLMDRPHQGLSDRLAADGLSPNETHPDRSWRLITDVTAGLATLHRIDLYHGGLHADSISLDRDGTAWIDDAGWGPLWHWSGHAYIPEGIQDYLTKDADGKPVEPSSPTGDVYALGMLSLRVVLGDKAPWSAEERREALLAAGLRRGQVELILRMLAGPVGGLRDARDVEAEFKRLERPIWRVLDNLIGPFKRLAVAATVAGLVLAILVVCLLLLASRSRDLEIRTAELEATRTELETEKGEHGVLKGDHKRLVEERETLQRHLTDERKVAVHEKLAREATIAALEATIEELKKDDAKKRLAIVMDQLKAKHQKELTAKEEILDAAEAHRHWLTLAYSPELGFEKMRERIDEIPNSHQKNLLKNWLDEFEKPPADAEGNPEENWWIILKEGRASPNAANKWRMRWNVRVKVASNEWQLLRDNHDWAEPTKQEYTPQPSVAVRWTPGQPIQVQLNEIGRTYNTPRIDRVFDGPLAIWQLHNASWLYHQDGQDWVGIKLAVWKCPGPSQR